MTPKDAMRAAVEAMQMKQRVTLWENDGDRAKFDSALSLLRSALDEGGEPTPVAWLFEGPGLRQLTKAGDFTKPVLDLHKRMALERPNKYTLTPLYASPIAAPKKETVPPLHPNHLPDLRYVLKVLQGAHVPERQHGDVQAAINGMRYIIKRTEDAAASPIAADTQGDANQQKGGA